MSGSGFGDALSVEELLAQTEPLLQIVARERAAGRHDLDDAVQEARIALWEVAERHPDKPPVYARVAAKMRMAEFLERGKPTGAPSHRGRRQVTEAASMDDPDVGIITLAADVLDGALLAYHEGEILAAIAALPERHQHYVRLRFWGGLTNAEIAPVLDVRLGNLERTWREAIKPQLAERLSHLAAA